MNNMYLGYATCFMFFPTISIACGLRTEMYADKSEPTFQSGCPSLTQRAHTANARNNRKYMRHVHCNLCNITGGPQTESYTSDNLLLGLITTQFSLLTNINKSRQCRGGKIIDRRMDAGNVVTYITTACAIDRGIPL